jgi:hypothetical protein
MSESGFFEDERAPSTPELCMQTVRDYAQDKFSKVDAVRAIFSAFFESAEYQDTPQNELDAAIGTYLAMFDQHDSSRQTSANRGTGYTRGSDDPEHEEDITRATGSKRPRDDSPIGQGPSKKRAPDESLFAWLADDFADETFLTTSQELTRKMVQNHALDLKLTKLKVLGAKRVPEFPDMEWNNVLLGKAVNLDVVFTGMFSTATDSRTIENLGELELHFGAAKPAKSVNTHGDWIIAWRIAFRATKFIFPHRENELDEYTEYISSYFASVQPSAHWKVFNLDKAIRKRVGSVNNISLNEFSKFRYLETRYLHGHGAGESGEPSKQKASERSGAGTNWRQTDPCRLWNDGKCDKKASSCKYRHICELCRGPHVKGDCIRGKVGST